MLNVAILMGRLVADPELRHTPNGVSVTSFTIAVDRSYVKQGEERQTDFIDIVAWRNTAEFACKWFKRGQLVAVQGVIQTRTYTDKDGNKRKAVEIIADNVNFAEPKREDPLSKMQSDAKAAGIPQYTNGGGDFEEIPSSDDLPF